MLGESHNLVTYLTLESAGDGKSKDHNGQTHRYACSSYNNSGARATSYALVPTVQSSGQKLLHN